MKVEWIPLLLIAKAAVPSVLATGGIMLSVETRRRVLERLAEHVDETARRAHDRISDELDSLDVADLR